MQPAQPCPCGSGAQFGRCCAPLHRGERQAGTAEQLMRSRYSAFVVGDADYLWRTWHPRTRPERVTLDPAVVWTGLDVDKCLAGASGDATGEVAFRAHHRDGVLHERSRFAVRAGRWFYVDGDVS